MAAGQRRQMNVVDVDRDEQIRVNEKNQAVYADELQTRWKVIFHI